MSEQKSRPAEEASLTSEQMKWLEKCCSTLHAAGVSTKPLTRLLSTLSGNSTVARGHLASLKDNLSRGRRRSMRSAEFQIEEIFSELWSLESLCFELQQAFESRETGSSSGGS